MIKHIIIGKQSNLSEALSLALDDAECVSARSVLQGRLDFQKHEGSHLNLILNNFQPANALNDLTKPVQYVEAAILSTSKVLEALSDSGVNVARLIYTSSSSVYGNNILCRESDELQPMNLHAALKVANEKMVEKFCLDHEIQYTIARIFNMYGRDDQFSVISKIIRAYKNKDTLQVVNQGNAIRDFVYIDDVVKVYEKLLETRNLPNVVNVGSGVGHSINGILNFLSNNGVDVDTRSCSRDEIKISTASIDILKKICYPDKMMDVNQFILEQLTPS